MHRITDSSKPDCPTVFHYDERGIKTKIETSRPEDYRPNVAVAGSPFEALRRAPNLPGGRTAVTIFDERDRATEIKVLDANRELVNRAIRTYDADDRVMVEEQILDTPETMIPSEIRTKWLEDSGFSADELLNEIRAKMTTLMAGHPGPYSVSYKYDPYGRVTHTHRRIFNEGDDIQTTYNDQGDIEREITRSTRVGDGRDSTDLAPQPFYSEVRYSYLYDQLGNWIEQAISYRNDTDSAFQPSTVTKRTLKYY